jgi:hypothetical protein
LWLPADIITSGKYITVLTSVFFGVHVDSLNQYDTLRAIFKK